MNPVRRLEPPPRAVDWGLAAAVATLAGTGPYGLFVDDPSGAWVFDVHAVAAFALVALLAFESARVPRRVRPDRLTGTRSASSRPAGAASSGCSGSPKSG